MSKYSKEVMETKPMNSPVPEKWLKKGGSISIDEKGTWTYTNQAGQSVSYPNGYPDFSNYMHPTVKPVEIEVASPENPFKAANLGDHAKDLVQMSKGEGTPKAPKLGESNNPKDFLDAALKRQNLDKSPASFKEKWSEAHLLINQILG